MSRLDVQNVTTNWRKSSGASSPGAGHPPVCSPSSPSALFRPLLGLLHCEIIHSLAFCMLHNWVNKAGTFSDSFPAVALDVIELTVRTLSEYRALREEQSGHVMVSLEEKFYARLRTCASSTYPLPLPHHWDLTVNIRHPVEYKGKPPTSTLKLLVGLQKVAEATDFRATLERVLQAVAAASPECAAELAEARKQAQPTASPSTSQNRQMDALKMKARERQKQLMEQMRAQQMKLENTVGFQGLLSAGESEKSGGEESPVADLQPASSPSLEDRDPSQEALQALQKALQSEVCALCHEMQSPQDSSLLGLICQVARTNVLRHATAQERRIEETGQPLGSPLSSSPNPSQRVSSRSRHDMTTENTPPFLDLAEVSGVTTLFCGHALHLDCFDSYHQFLLKSAQTETYKGHNFLYLESGEFLCPLCGRLGNAVCPVLSEAPGGRLADGFGTRSQRAAGTSLCKPTLWVELHSQLLQQAGADTTKTTGLQRHRDQLESFVTAMLLASNNHTPATMYGRNSACADAKDLFSFACSSLGMHLAVLELNARTPDASSDASSSGSPLGAVKPLLPQVRAAALLRNSLRAVVDFSFHFPFDADGFISVLTCASAASCVPAKGNSPGDSASESSAEWPPLL
eukprot:RCo030870